MPIFKNEDTKTWYVMARYTDWKGERKQKCKRGFATRKEALEWEREFLQLKQVLLPEIDIVQMLYSNQLSYNTVYNYDCEYRPKLFKRIRPFLFRDPIHEILTTDPVIFDSDIVITHMPDSCHACRDFQSMVQIEASKHPLSNRLLSMYARELFIAGADSDFLNAQAAFLRAIALPDVGTDLLLEATCVLAKCALIQKNEQSFFRYALKNIALKGCSEMCYLIGNYYETIDDKKEALIWYQNAATETDCILNLSYQEKYAPEKISTIQSSV